MPKEPYSIYRNLIEIYLKESSKKHLTHTWTTFDITTFQHYTKEALGKKKRPPSLIAYWMRCLGKIASKHPNIMGRRKGNYLITPDHVDVAMVMEAKMPDNTWLPWGWVFERMEEKSFQEIEKEVLKAARTLRRGKGTVPPFLTRFLHLPRWLQNSLIFLSMPIIKKKINDTSSLIGLTSLAQMSSKSPAFGIPFSTFSLTITLGSIVSGEESFVGVTFSANHAVTDTRLLAEFMDDLYKEVASGACLSEREPKDAPQPE
jgi:chloramphenicol O-acetyltransferase